MVQDLSEVFKGSWFIPNLMCDTISVQPFFYISAFTHPSDRYSPDFGCPNLKSSDPKIHREQYVAYYPKTTILCRLCETQFVL